MRVGKGRVGRSRAEAQRSSLWKWQGNTLRPLPSPMAEQGDTLRLDRLCHLTGDPFPFEPAPMIEVRGRVRPPLSCHAEGGCIIGCRSRSSAGRRPPLGSAPECSPRRALTRGIGGESITPAVCSRGGTPLTGSASSSCSGPVDQQHCQEVSHPVGSGPLLLPCGRLLVQFPTGSPPLRRGQGF